jgi:hypothetical protein
MARVFFATYVFNPDIGAVVRIRFQLSGGVQFCIGATLFVLDCERTMRTDKR